MIKNYIKIAWRNLVRNRAYSLINIIGLSVGIASCLLIFLYIQDELSYDQFNKESDRIYRVDMSDNFGGTSEIPGVAKNTFTGFPEVEATVRYYHAPQIILGEEGNIFQEKNFFYADSSFFEVFSFPLIKGDPAKVLSQPNGVVLTKSTAHKYFGDANPMGQTMTMRNGKAFVVTGIAGDVPHNSSIQFDMLASYSTLDEPKGMDDQGKLFLLLNRSKAAISLQSRLDDLTKGSLDKIGQNLGYAFKDMRLGLQPLAKIRLYPALDGAIQPPGDARYLYIFGAIGLVILIIACINYMNLATATSMQRAREVGMRKALGAQRYQLAGQFLAESIFFTGISFLVALALAQLLLPVFGTLTGKSLSFFDLQSWPFTRYSLLFILITGCLSGGYPVLVLSSFLPQRVLKGSGSLNNKSKLRQGLVIFQFVIATVLMIGTLVIRHQLTYIRHKRLGYDAEHVVSLPMTKSLGDRLSAGVLKPDPKRITTVRQTLSGLPGVQDVSVAFSTPNGYLTSEVKYQGQSYQVTNLPVDYNYAKTMKFQFLAGRNFSKKHATDSSKAVIVNETAAKLFNLKDKVGQSIDLNLGHTHPTLIGIVKDFHTASLHHHIRPTILTIEPAYYDAYVVRLAAGSLPGVLGLMKRAWKKLAPQYPFTYHFLEDQLEAQYQPERRAGQIFASFSTLAIIIACLGLFGLAAYTAELRIREIGIRKVMGATVANIIGLLSKDFLTLVLLGFVIAIPIAWYAMHRWLTNFAYHIDIGVGIFAVAGTIALLIAVATVSWQSIRAALANPVDSLRNE